MPLLVALFLCLAASLASAQTSSVNGQPPLDGTISGIVTNDEGDPIEGATICTNYENAQGGSTSCGVAESDKRGQFELHVPLGETGVFARKQESGYWSVIDASPSHRKGIYLVKLTRAAPTATVTLKIGPRPGLLKFDVKDKVTGKPIEAYTPRWIGVDDQMMWSMQIPATRTPIPAGIDVIIEVHAQGYHRWFYVDPSTSQPTLRVASGEEKQLDVEMEPDDGK